MSTNRMLLAAALSLSLAGTAAWAQTTPGKAVAAAVAASEAFPAGTSVVSVTVDGASAVVDLSMEAAPAGLGDAQADAMVKAVVDALAAWPEITAIEVTVAGQPLWQYLPRATEGGAPAAAPASGPAAAPAGPNDPIPPTSWELAGKMIALHPSHGSYWHQTYGYWMRAMRTLTGPNPTPVPPGWTGSTYQPSNYYFYTMGYQWPSLYEDDMSPETIRFLKAYLESSAAEVWCSRNLDKNAGDFPVPYGPGAKYPSCSFPLPKWQTAAKYYLEDRGDVPEWVWNEPSLTAETDKDIRARAYYANYRMSLKYPGQDQSSQAVWGNCLSFSLHSNAAGSGTARGTETYWYTSMYPYLQTQAVAYCTAVEDRTINAIRNLYDGTWANAVYQTPPPPREEWNTAITYYGYQHDGGASYRWQDRGVKTSNFGEIRECKMPAQLMELAFHDNWKFYPDHVFLMDQIWRSTVAWGIYEGMCQYWGITPKARLAAAVVSTDFPAWVRPGAAIAGSVTMQNLGQAWCWGHKFDAATKVYAPYTVWVLRAEASDQFAPGTKIAVAPDARVYPGETATFAIALTAPAAEGTYTTAWKMLKDDAKGGAFGGVATAQIGVDGTAPAITITSPVQATYPPGCVPVTFDATDEASGVATLAGTIDGEGVTSGSGVCDLAIGPHTLTVTATDSAGNTVQQSVPFSIGFVAADFDADGDVDLSDFATFQSCYNGPNNPPAQPGCEAVDFNADGDVDLGDFAVFQGCFNGANQLPGCTG